jgi:predicted transglutaminase-like cysteine proteinase
MIKKLCLLFLYVIVSNLCIAGQPPDTATQRLLAWKQLIRYDKSKDTQTLLADVNDFFNRLHYIPETDSQGEPDVWMTPYEFLEAGAGDCEDFAIAKYFTLVALGIPEKKLRITYVTIQSTKQAHMVLTYYPTMDSEPLVLDNILKRIVPASQRPDLIPIYSFNGEDVWFKHTNPKDHPYAKASSLSKWEALKTRLKQQGGIK